jgi:hypothetical protein
MGKMKVTCKRCSIEVPADQHCRCPRCAGRAKAFRVSFSDALNFNDRLDLEHRRAYYQNNRRALVFGVAFTLITSIIGVYFSGLMGFLIALFLGGLSLWVMPSPRTKVVENTRARY